MVGEERKISNRPLAVQSLTRKFSVSAISVCAHVMEKRVHHFKRTFSLRNLLNNHNNKSNNNKKQIQRTSSLSHGFSFRRTPSRKLDIYFPYIRGPDVKPPRNERRTLKLNKTKNDGFGFWLQTYGFSKNGNDVKKRTLVRYVEDEGPAYMAGLREGDVLVKINDQNVEDIEHAQIVEIIKQETEELKLVVKFIDAVRRVELAIRLKKRQAKLKSKMEELERLQKDEYNLLNGLPITTDYASNGDSMASLPEAEVNSLHTSTESEISSISSLSDEVTVRTSKFGKRSSHVLDSIKELNCSESFTIKNNHDRVSTTTEDELLDFYCDGNDYTTSLPRRSRVGSGLKRVETMPVQKYRSLPRKRVIDLDGSQAREYAIDFSTMGYIPTDPYISNESGDEDSSDESARNSFTENSNDDRSKSPMRRNRPKSYKLAMHTTKNILEGEINQV